MKITICGCGNGAHACAALMGIQGHDITIYSPISQEVALFKEAYQKSNGLTMRFGAGLLSQTSADTINDEHVTTVSGIKLANITDDAAEAISDAAVVFVITPAFAHQNILQHIRKHLMKSCVVAFLPSRGGLEYELFSTIPGVSAIAFQTLPWATRIKTFGQEVLISGRKQSILAASVPKDLSTLIFSQLEHMLEMQIVRVRDIATMTLSNVGQIIHPGIMYSLFHHNPSQVYAKKDIPFFYQGINEEDGERLSAMSDEIISIARAAAQINPDIEVDKVLHLRDWLLASYSDTISDTSSLTQMFKTNSSYDGLKAPVKKTAEDQYIADFTTRYITEDVPYGLLISKSIAMMFDIATPAIDEVLTGIDRWTDYAFLERLQAVKALSKASRLPELYGLNTASRVYTLHD